MTVQIGFGGRARAQVRIDFEPLPAPGMWEAVGTIIGIDGGIVQIAKSFTYQPDEFRSWTIDVGDALTKDILAAIGNALTGTKLRLMTFAPVTIAPPEGPALTLSFTNPAASLSAAPDGQLMLAITGDITAAKAD